jgi:hypothetical protein
MPKEEAPHKALRAAKNKGGKILYVPRDWDNFQVWDLPDGWNYFEESKDVQEEVLFQIAEGKTLTGACRHHGLPVSLVLLMAEKDENFDKALRTAMRFRAETYHDRYANIADEVDERNAKAMKVKADILQALMRFGNRDKFGEQKKISTESTQTITFVVDTGIRRELAEAISTEGRTLDDASHDQDQHGLPAPDDAAVDSLQAEALLGAGLSPEVREISSLHQRDDRPVPEEREAEPEVCLLRPVLQPGQEGHVGLPQAVYEEYPGDDVQ